MTEPTTDDDRPNGVGGELLERLLLDAGIEVDPDDLLGGRHANEAEAADLAPSPDDPWAEASPVVAGLTDEQRSWVDSTSPTFGGALPTQSLTGDDPFGPLDQSTIDEADRDVIDFDDDTDHDG